MIKKIQLFTIIVIGILLIVSGIFNLYLSNKINKQKSTYEDEYFKRLILESELAIVKEKNVSLQKAKKEVDIEVLRLMEKVEEEANKEPEVVIVETIITNTISGTVDLKKIDEQHYKIDPNDMLIAGDIYINKSELSKFDYQLKPHKYRHTTVMYDSGYSIVSIYDQTLIDYAESIKHKDKKLADYYIANSRILDVKVDVYRIDNPNNILDGTAIAAGGGFDRTLFIHGGAVWNKNLVLVSIDADKEFGASYTRFFSLENIFKKGVRNE